LYYGYNNYFPKRLVSNNRPRPAHHDFPRQLFKLGIGGLLQVAPVFAGHGGFPWVWRFRIAAGRFHR
jgi:hypothetical protein